MKTGTALQEQDIHSRRHNSFWTDCFLLSIEKGKGHITSVFIYVNISDQNTKQDQ